MRRTTVLGVAILAILSPVAASELPRSQTVQRPADVRLAGVHADSEPRPAALDHPDVAMSAALLAHEHQQARLQGDLAAMQTFRPGYAFWQHIFTIPDGSIAFGSATDGRLLAIVPGAGDWTRRADWKDPALADILRGQQLPARLADRRDRLAQLLEAAVGQVLHNPTRGRFLLPNLQRYGPFLDEWGAIYERFGVPAEIGLAQVIIESGLNGTIRSEARAVGFCQWLPENWRRLQQLAPNVIEAHNQTSQAPYCAAYLSVLAAQHDTFIPALSEHHAGGTNVRRTMINGGRLGSADIREQYFLGAQLARDLRALAPGRHRQIYGTYGPRSFLYAEMVFGNRYNVARLRQEIPQAKIYAMRAPRAIPLAEITRRTGLTADEVRRFNPALVRQVPARANLYLPFYVKEFGPDVSFWRRPPSPAFASVLNDFVRLDAAADQWDEPSFQPILREFQQRFRKTDTEEGAVMAAVLAYKMDEMYRSRRAAILAEFRTSERIQQLFEQAVRERDASRGTIVSR
jgi:hypothetical protein